MLLHDYELFHILSYDSISDMYTHFIKIATSLHASSREFTNSKKVSCFSESWHTKVTIYKSKDLSMYSIDQLLRSLITHQQKIF